MHTALHVSFVFCFTALICSVSSLLLLGVKDCRHHGRHL